MEQMMCASGYTDQFTGLVTSLFLACGTLASLPVTLVLGKMKPKDIDSNQLATNLNIPSLNYAKAAMTVGSGCFIAMLQFVQMPNLQVEGLLTPPTVEGIVKWLT